MSLEDAFRDQAATCIRMGSPLTGQVLKILSKNWNPDSALAKSLDHYSGDLGPAGHSIPLRIAGGLHALALTGKDAGLAAEYPPRTATDALEKAVCSALRTHEAFFIDWTQNAPQTNEVRRSAALIAMARVACARFDRPIVLSELGASSGLNLNWDRFALDVQGTRIGPDEPVLTLSPDWEGPLPPVARPVVAARGGVDLNPLDPTKPDDLLRMSSYLWADQPDRMTLTRAAAAIQTTLVEKGDAIDWLARRLHTAPHGHMHLIQHTVAWQYFPAQKQSEGRAMIEDAGRKATPETPLAWMQMETDGDKTGGIGAALTLRLWPGDLTLHLGRADFHGRWITWTGPQSSTG